MIRAAAGIAFALILSAVPASAQTAVSAASIASAVGDFAGWVNTAIQIGGNWGEFTSAYERLHEDDAEYEPDYSPPGSPDVPISCEADACIECYQRAIDRLNFVRATLERLRAIHSSTNKMASAAISFGDSASGIHAVSGLAWQAQRRGIVRELEKLDVTYDGKYKGLMGTLESALRQMAECERVHYDNPDWYNRFGFIYFTFMSDRYKRGT